MQMANKDSEIARLHKMAAAETGKTLHLQQQLSKANSEVSRLRARPQQQSSDASDYQRVVQNAMQGVGFG